MKQDLNLIPKKESTDTLHKLLLPLLLFVLILCSALYVGIRIPRSIYRQKDLANEGIKVKIGEMAGIEDNYIAAMQSLDFLQSQQATISETSGSEKSALSVLTMLERACPQDVSLISVVASRLSITVKGVSPDDTSVAEFTVNLRSTGIFDITNISIITPSEMENSDGTGKTEVRAFSLMLTYPAQAAQEEQTGGNGQ